MICLLNSGCLKEISSDLSSIDNDATRQLTYSFHHFIEYNEFQLPQNVKTSGKDSILALGEETIKVTSEVDGSFKSFDFKNIWLAPGLSKNLFPLLAAQNRNPKVRGQLYQVSFDGQR